MMASSSSPLVLVDTQSKGGTTTNGTNTTQGVEHTKKRIQNPDPNPFTARRLVRNG